MKIASVWDATNVCHLHRTRYPFTYLCQDFPEHDWELSLVDVPPDLDVLWLYGAYKMENMAEIMKLKRKGVKLVFGMDDNYWDFPSWRFDRPSDLLVATIEILAELADEIVVSTPALGRAIKQPKKTIVAPNLLDVRAYRLQTPPADEDVIRVLWCGSPTHKGDLSLVDEACCEILKRQQKGVYGKPVQFTFVGLAPDRVMRDNWNSNVNYMTWVPLSDYWWTLHNLRPHITLAPLDDCEFNRCKSAIRVQEAWSMYSACITSPVGEYKEVSSKGHDCFYASTTDEWIDKIDSLIRNRDVREYLTANGYKKVKEEWNWTSPLARKKWHPAVEGILQLQTHH